MATNVRLKLVGEDPELDRVEQSLKAASTPYRRFLDLDEACDNQEQDPSDLFVLGSTLYFQSHLNTIQKLDPRPDVLLAVGSKLPNLAKILVPRILYAEGSPEEIQWEIQATGDYFRRARRLEALRDHQKRSWNLDANPAINLVTNLMRKCTMAEEYGDLLQSVLPMRSIVDFHDASLVVLDGNGNVVKAWHSPREGRDGINPISSPQAIELLAGMEDGQVVSFSSSSDKHPQWDSLTSHPWSFGMALRFSQGEALRNPKTTRSALLVLYRRELVPFVERDFWLLDMAHGPLALALEKVSMLKAIGQASKEWRSTFDGISEPLTVIDSNYQIVKANKAFARLVDQDIKKLKGKRCFTLLANRRTPCTGCPVGTETQPQGGTRVQSQGKHRKDLLVWSYGIRTGLRSYHFQFYRNVSTETMLTSTLIQSEKMAALGRLVGAVAHEINNPLAGILATSQILLSEKEGIDASVQDDLEEIRSAALRSKKIIGDLLGFTDAGQRPVEKADLLDVVRSTLVFAKAALREATVVVVSDVESPVAMIPVNALQQVLFNLLTNAAQAMNGRGDLEISVRRGEGGFSLHVKDSGPGIPPEKLKHIFDPFYTSKQEGMGTGLGLSIVRNLTQRMGARIEVSSIVGKGTEFVLHLPASEGIVQ